MERLREIYAAVIEKKGYLRYPLVFLTAFASAWAELFGKISPFAPAFIGSVSGADCIFAFLGSVCAYLLKGRFFEAVPCVAAMMVIGVFRFIFCSRSFSGAKWVNLCSAFLTGISVLIVNAVIVTKPSEIITPVVFAAIAGVLSYCLTVTYRVLSAGRMTVLLTPEDACALGIVFTFATTALSYFERPMFNAGIIAAALISLAFADKYRFTGGAVCGVIGGFGVILAGNDYAAGVIVFGAAATASALFARFNKITQTAGFILVMGLGISATGLNSLSLTVMASAIAGGALYMLVPTELFTDKLFSRSRNTGVKAGADMSEIFAERLRVAGNALNDVRTAVEKAGEYLDKRNNKDISWIYNAAADTVCKSCKNNMVCWGSEYSDTVSAFDKLAARLRAGEALSADCLPAKLESRCERRQELAYALNARYREYVTVNSANRKMTEMRTVLTAQLSATESLMLDMSEEFTDYIRYDRQMAAVVEKILADNGISRPRAAVTISESRVLIEGYGKGTLACDGDKLRFYISAALQKEFDPPETMNAGNEFRFTMYERAVYGVEYGAFQLSKSGEKSCGDYYESFVDGKGFAYIVLSDGMGSGSRARVDSAFACGMLVKLLKANIGLPSAIEIINNSLLVKSSDESFATLDICKIDLYSGKTELYKAGAAASYIKSNKRVYKAAGKGLPVGIGYRAVYEAQSFIAGNADVIIMASDGAELNERWLERELNGGDTGDMNRTAETIANSARFAAEKGREDDISVIAVKLVK